MTSREDGLDTLADPSTPFGAFCPSPTQQAVRRLARNLPRTWVGRKIASALLGPAGGRTARPYDVEVFGDLRARLYPADNICEKRVYMTPDHWDPAERCILAETIGAYANRNGDRPFQFVDVGANAGLYTLFAFASGRQQGKALRALCIDADETMVRRLETNIALNELDRHTQIVCVAVGDRAGVASLEVNRRSRGQSRLSVGGTNTINVQPLVDVLQNAGVSYIDAMKIDIEGHEAPTLRAFFRDAPPSLWPPVLIAEISHDATLRQPIMDAGYTTVLSNTLNAVFQRKTPGGRS